MKTEQILQRQFLDGIITQNHKTSWFNATNLIAIANKYRETQGLLPKNIADYLKKKETKEFVATIAKREQISEVFSVKKGKNGGTWVHPLLLIDIMMWLSPDFKYQAMQWLQDNLTKFRDTSGDDYKKLTSVLCQKIPISKVGIIIPEVAKKIKNVCKVEDWNAATEQQLKQRVEIQKDFILLCEANVEPDKALHLAIKNNMFN